MLLHKRELQMDNNILNSPNQQSDADYKAYWAGDDEMGAGDTIHKQSPIPP